jgi:hypothetical protein
MATLYVSILDIIVNECEVVCKLNRYSGGERAL